MADRAVAATERVGIDVRVNGERRRCHVSGGESVLDVLRDHLGLTGTKRGCDAGECGACTVIMDGIAVCACLVPARRAEGAEIVTVEGVTPPSGLSALQQALVDFGAFQCGFCTPGVVMSLSALFARVDRPDEAQIREALQGNVCRCSGYGRLIEAAKAVALRGVG